MRAVKEMSVPETSGRALLSFPQRVNRFYRDVRAEMGKVTWPNREDVISTTVTVLITTFFFGYYMGVGLDIPFAWLMEWLIDWGKTLVL